ncbi:MAG: hypothetical protein K2K32_01585, partial [Muribaculaceae bacterium]|nr:hypothetical protein [Muribaculaceae bacterium]
TTYSHPNRVSLIPAMRSEASEPQRTLLPKAAALFRSASPLNLCARFLMCAVMLISLAACSDQNGKDDPNDPGFEEGIPTEVRINLSTRSGNGTRDDGTPKDPTSSIELIHDWWIVFVAKNGDVKVIKRDEVEEKERITSTSVNIGDGFEAETFKTILPSGTYRIYAFANIKPMTAEKFKGSFLNAPEKEGDEWKHKTINLDSFIEKNRFSNSEGDSMLWHPKYIDTDKNEVDNNIPMSAVMTNIKINNTVENAFNVEVIRAVAKVEFAFHNPSTDQITLNTLNFGPISNRPYKISIIPNYDAVGKGPNKKLFENISKCGKVGTGTLTFNSNSNFSLTKDESNQYSMGRFNFYCMESIPDTEKGGSFTIKLDVTRNGEKKEYEYQTKNITYINRNDWVFIPIKFNDWIIYWKLHYYPPIGGYPPVFNQNADGSSLSATLTTGGEFELYPYKIERNSEAVDYKNDVDWDRVELSQLTDAEKNLFVSDKLPTKMVNPNYHVTGHPLKDLPNIITGEFKPNAEGKVELKIIFYLKNTDSKYQDFQYADTKFECTFTITRQNKGI